jgi:hypothetical protein
LRICKQVRSLGVMIWGEGRSNSTLDNLHHHPARTLSGPGWSPPPPRTMTTFKAALKADWAPAIESAARFIGMFIACVIVAADWLRFTWQHPWAGLRALEFPGATSSPNLTTSSPNLAVSSPNLDAAIAAAERCALAFGGNSSEVVDWLLRRQSEAAMQNAMSKLAMLPVTPEPLLLPPAPEPIAPAPAPRKRGRRATRQPKVAA